MVLGISVQEVNNLENDLSGEIGGVWVHFSATDACKTMTPPCPVKGGTMATYVYSLQISNSYPPVSDLSCTVVLLNKCF